MRRLSVLNQMILSILSRTDLNVIELSFVLVDRHYSFRVTLGRLAKEEFHVIED